MIQPDNFLHTTHRTITWFKKAFTSEELISCPVPTERRLDECGKNFTCWTRSSNGLPIPELYMQDVGNEASANEKHIVVDGQQRIRAVLDYVQEPHA